MLRTSALALLLLPTLVGAGQGLIRGPQDRSKVLDAAALTPFFTKKGAESVKKVMNGADQHKSDEKVLEPIGEPLPIAPGQTGPKGLPGPQGPEGQGAPQQPAPPVAEPIFAWRLVGISYGKKQGMALFQGSGQSQSVCEGTKLDPDTEVILVTRTHVVLNFHGKRFDLTPW